MTYKYELHAHTKNVSSCGRIYASELVQKYKELGYSGIVITDHYSPRTFSLHLSGNGRAAAEYFLGGYREAKKYEDENFKVFPGLEVRFYATANDYLVYGLSEEAIENLPFLLPMRLPFFTRKIRKLGGIVVQAHPYRKLITRANPKNLDGAEIYNGKESAENNLKAKKWAEENNIAILTAGSDAHRDNSVGTAAIVTGHFIESNEDLLNVLKNGDFTIEQKQNC